MSVGNGFAARAMDRVGGQACERAPRRPSKALCRGWDWRAWLNLKPPPYDQKKARELPREAVYSNGAPHHRVAGGLSPFHPLVTFARFDKVSFKPQPFAFWRSMQEIGGKQ